MVRTIFAAGLVVLTSGHLYGQASAQFEAATIQPVPPQSGGQISTKLSSDTKAGSLNYTNVSLKDVILNAYQVHDFQVRGPAWLDTERFDITAKFTPHSAPAQIPLMLQSLLANRFHLTLHQETQQQPEYALTVAKDGPRLKSAGSASSITSDSKPEHGHVAAKVSMRRFAEFLSTELSRPVIDQTGLNGSFEFTLDWTPGEAATPGSLFTSLQEELGLKLDATTGPVELLVVDQADRTPSER